MSDSLILQKLSLGFINALLYLLTLLCFVAAIWHDLFSGLFTTHSFFPCLYSRSFSFRLKLYFSGKRSLPSHSVGHLEGQVRATFLFHALLDFNTPFVPFAQSQRGCTRESCNSRTNWRNLNQTLYGVLFMAFKHFVTRISHLWWLEFLIPIIIQLLQFVMFTGTRGEYYILYCLADFPLLLTELPQRVIL